MRNKNINHARNLWDRAVTIMPRVNQFWYKYIHMEEMLGNYVGVRTLFERWMEWQPDKYAWSKLIVFVVIIFIWLFDISINNMSYDLSLIHNNFFFSITIKFS